MRDRIVELTMSDYNRSLMKIIVGYLENALSIKTIILITNKIIHTTMKEERRPHMLKIKNDIKNFNFQERYRHYIRG